MLRPLHALAWVALLGIGVRAAFAVSLAWDPSPSEEVVGYEIHVGHASGQYDYTIDVGQRVTAPMPSLAVGQTYYFAVGAYDAGGRRSALSNEVSFRAEEADALPPTAQISVEPRSGPAPHVVRLSVESSASMAWYRWDFGDGSSHISNSMTSSSGLSHEYTEPGAYFVHFTAGGAGQTMLSLQAVPVIATAGGCPCSLFGAAVPRIPDIGPSEPMTVGVRFKVLVNGTITGLRIFRSTGNLGSRVAHLWTHDGRLLARLDLAEQSAAGWHFASFERPVTVNQGQLLVASYHSPEGHHARDEGLLLRGLTNGPLQILPYRTGAPSGVYASGDAPTFPGTETRGAHFGVDVVFALSDQARPTNQSRSHPAMSNIRGGDNNHPKPTPRTPATMSRMSK